jgi:hypothetical protein
MMFPFCYCLIEQQLPSAVVPIQLHLLEIGY